MQGNYKIKHIEKLVEVTAEIVKACLRDDRRAIKSLYMYCFKQLMPVCFRYHHNEEDARAALNMGFMKILKGLETIEGEFNFNAWSKRIMINSLIDEYRRNKKHSEHLHYRETERELELNVDSVVNSADSNFGCDAIMKMVDDLPPISAKVFNLYVIDGYNHKEIGELLSISEGTSKWHLSTARKILRDKLEKIETVYKKMVI